MNQRHSKIHKDSQRFTLILSEHPLSGYPDIRSIWISAPSNSIIYPIRIEVGHYLYLPDGKMRTIWFTPDSIFAVGYTPYSVLARGRTVASLARFGSADSRCELTLEVRSGRFCGIVWATVRPGVEGVRPALRPSLLGSTRPMTRPWTGRRLWAWPLCHRPDRFTRVASPGAEAGAGFARAPSFYTLLKLQSQDSPRDGPVRSGAAQSLTF